MTRIGWLCVVALAACANTKQEKISATEAFGQPVQTGPSGPSVGAGDAVPVATTMNPERFARGFKRPLECEQGARSIQRAAPDKAWAYLRACVNRGGFNLLPTLLDYWANDLKNRPDGPVVLASVIAARGGHVMTDLQLLQSKRLPLFDLKSALTQPGTYKGRYVVFVGKVAAVKEVKGKVEVAIGEQAIGTEAVDKIKGPRYTSSSSYGGSASGSYSTSHSGSGRGSMTYGGGSSHSSGYVEETFQETFEDTGQDILAKLANVDPFLAVDKQFLFLVKFDAAKTSDTSKDDDETSEEPSKLALVSLVSYHPINEQYTWGQ